MTAKEYKRMCRIKANMIAKFVTYCVQQLLLVVAYMLSILSGANLVLAVISVTLWFYLPDLVIHILEDKYRIKHDKVSYK